MIEFKLPFIGADVDEGKLLAWHIRPGDAVRRGQIVAVVDTSKAAVDVESWQEGTVFELLVQPGETVPVGTVLARLLEQGETAEAAQHAQPVSRIAAVPAASAPAMPLAPAPMAAASVPAARRRVSPAARKHAADHGIDIDSVTGTGPDGAVTLQDVEQAAVLRTQPPPQSQPAATDRQAQMRKSIAAAMSRSKKEIPHYYLSETVPMRKAQAWLSAANEKRSISERLLMAALQLKAVALALKKYPGLNGFYLNGMHQPSQAIHVGVAISLRQGGLIAPAIHDVSEKSLDQLMRDLVDLVKRARAGSLRSSEMSDPTITVTNLGEQGVETVYGVIYPPQVALIGFGRVAERPWVASGKIEVRSVLTATLSADHRATDGHRGGVFLTTVDRLLQTPEKL